MSDEDPDFAPSAFDAPIKTYKRATPTGRKRGRPRKKPEPETGKRKSLDTTIYSNHIGRNTVMHSSPAKAMDLFRPENLMESHPTAPVVQSMLTQPPLFNSTQQNNEIISNTSNTVETIVLDEENFDGSEDLSIEYDTSYMIERAVNDTEGLNQGSSGIEKNDTSIPTRSPITVAPGQPKPFPNESHNRMNNQNDRSHVSIPKSGSTEAQAANKSENFPLANAAIQAALILDPTELDLPGAVVPFVEDQYLDMEDSSSPDRLDSLVNSLFDSSPHSHDETQPEKTITDAIEPVTPVPSLSMPNNSTIDVTKEVDVIMEDEVITGPETSTTIPEKDLPAETIPQMQPISTMNNTNIDEKNLLEGDLQVAGDEMVTEGSQPREKPLVATGAAEPLPTRTGGLKKNSNAEVEEECEEGEEEGEECEAEEVMDMEKNQNIMALLAQCRAKAVPLPPTAAAPAPIPNTSKSSQEPSIPKPDQNAPPGPVGAGTSKKKNKAKIKAKKAKTKKAKKNQQSRKLVEDSFGNLLEQFNKATPVKSARKQQVVPQESIPAFTQSVDMEIDPEDDSNAPLPIQAQPKPQKNAPVHKPRVEYSYPSRGSSRYNQPSSGYQGSQYYNPVYHNSSQSEYRGGYGWNKSYYAPNSHPRNPPNYFPPHSGGGGDTLYSSMPSDPSLVIDMNEVSDSEDSEKEETTSVPNQRPTSLKNSQKKQAQSKDKGKGKNQTQAAKARVATKAATNAAIKAAVHLANAKAAAKAGKSKLEAEQKVREQEEEIQRLQHLLQETTKTIQQSTPQGRQKKQKKQNGGTKRQVAQSDVPSVLKKRTRQSYPSTELQASKLFKIDVDISQIEELRERVKGRADSVVSKKKHLFTVHKEYDQLIERQSDLKTKKETCRSRISILEEKLKFLRNEQLTCEQDIKETDASVERMKENIYTAENLYLSERSFLEQERVMLSELEIEQRLVQEGIPSSFPFRSRVSDYQPPSPATPTPTPVTPTTPAVFATPVPIDPITPAAVPVKPTAISVMPTAVPKATIVQPTTIPTPISTPVATPASTDVAMDICPTVATLAVSPDVPAVVSGMIPISTPIAVLPITTNPPVSSGNGFPAVKETKKSTGIPTLLSFNKIPQEKIVAPVHVPKQYISQKTPQALPVVSPSKEIPKEAKKQTIQLPKPAVVRTSSKMPPAFSTIQGKIKSPIAKKSKDSAGTTSKPAGTLKKMKKSKLTSAELEERLDNVKRLIEEKRKAAASSSPSSLLSSSSSESTTQKESVDLFSFHHALLDTSFTSFEGLPGCVQIIESSFGTLPPLSSEPKEGMVPTFPLLKEKVSSYHEKYTSPLHHFRSYRMSPHFQSQGGKSITGPELLYDIDPTNVLCRFEMNGTCNDDECPWEHFERSKRSSQRLLDICAQYARARTNSKELSPAIDTLLQLINKQIGKGPTESLICTFVREVNQLATDEHYIPNTSSSSFSSLASLNASTSSKEFSRPHLSSATLLGIGASPSSSSSSSSSKKRSFTTTRIQTMHEVEPMTNLLQHDIIPLYEQKDSSFDRKENPPQTSIGYDKRYYQISDKNYDAFLEEDPHNISLWLHYAFSKMQHQATDGNPLLPMTPKQRMTSCYNALIVLVKALESNPSSLEIWRMYVDYFARSGSSQNIGSILHKATSYVPYSYSIWHLRWNTLPTSNQKLDTLHIAIETYLQYSSETSDITGPSTQIVSESLLHFILASGYLLSSMGHTSFVEKRLTRFFRSRDVIGKLPRTKFPFDLANQFMQESQIVALWEKLAEKELCVLASYLAYLIAFDTFPCSYTSFTKRLAPISISWIEARQKTATPELLSTKGVTISEVFDNTLAFCSSQTKEVLAIQTNYISMVTEYNEPGIGIKIARKLCKTFIQTSPHSIELINYYAFIESRFDVHIAEAIYARAAQEFPSSQAIWYSFATFLALRGNTVKTISVLLQSVGVRVTKEGSIAPEDVSKAHETFKIKLEGNERDDVFIWLNYALLLSLLNESPQKIFERASLFAFPRSKRKFLFKEYLRWQLAQKVSRGVVLATLDKIFNCIGPDVNSLLKDETAPELLRHSVLYSHFVPPSAEDYSFVNEMVSMVIDHISNVQGKELVLNLYLQRFPRNYAVHFQLACLYEKQNELNKARKAFVSTLKLCPTFVPGWEGLLDLELKHNPSEVRTLLLAAQSHLPDNERINAKQIALEAHITPLESNR